MAWIVWFFLFNDEEDEVKMLAEVAKVTYLTSRSSDSDLGFFLLLPEIFTPHFMKRAPAIMRGCGLCGDGNEERECLKGVLS